MRWSGRPETGWRRRIAARRRSTGLGEEARGSAYSSCSGLSRLVWVVGEVEDDHAQLMVCSVSLGAARGSGERRRRRCAAEVRAGKKEKKKGASEGEGRRKPRRLLGLSPRRGGEQEVAEASSATQELGNPRKKTTSKILTDRSSGSFQKLQKGPWGKELLVLGIF